MVHFCVFTWNGCWYGGIPPPHKSQQGHFHVHQSVHVFAIPCSKYQPLCQHVIATGTYPLSEGFLASVDSDVMMVFPLLVLILSKIEPDIICFFSKILYLFANWNTGWQVGGRAVCLGTLVGHHRGVRVEALFDKGSADRQGPNRFQTDAQLATLAPRQRKPRVMILCLTAEG